jgi:glycosyltransferase involved in cell wall biosynthesis
LRILIVIGQLDVGGTERHLLQVLPRLNRTPLEFRVATLRRGGALAEPLRRAGVPVSEPPPGLPRWTQVLPAAFQLLGLMLLWRPRIVHFFLPEAYLLGGLLSLMAPGATRVMSRRSLNRYQERHRRLARLERWLHRRMDAVLANSQAVAAELRAEGVAAERITVICNGVETAAAADRRTRLAARRRLDLEDEAFVMVMVANLIPYKGHRDVLAALAGIRDRLPQPWRMLFVGRDDGIGAELAEAARRLGLDSGVRWLGQRDNVPEVLAAADLAVLASHQEGFSNALLEAMAAGLPAVATDVGGTREALLDGQTGLLVAPGVPDALAAKILELAHDEAKRRAMGEAASRRVAETFPLEQVIDAYRRLYADLAGAT